MNAAVNATVYSVSMNAPHTVSIRQSCLVKLVQAMDQVTMPFDRQSLGETTICVVVLDVLQLCGLENKMDVCCANKMMYLLCYKNGIIDTLLQPYIHVTMCERCV